MPPGVTVNKFGLRPDLPLSDVPDGLQIANDAREAARNAGLSRQEVEDAAMKAVADHIKKLEDSKNHHLHQAQVIQQKKILTQYINSLQQIQREKQR